MKFRILLLLILLTQLLFADGTTLNVFTFKNYGAPVSILYGDDMRSASINPALLVSIGKQKGVNVLFERRFHSNNYWELEDGELMHIHSLGFVYPQAAKNIDLAIELSTDRSVWKTWGWEESTYKSLIMGVTASACFDSLIHFGVTVNRLSFDAGKDTLWADSSGGSYAINLGVVAAKDIVLPKKIVVTPRLASTLNNIAREEMDSYMFFHPKRYLNFGVGAGITWSQWISLNHQLEFHFHINADDYFEPYSYFYLSQHVGITPFFTVENIYRYRLEEDTWEHQNSPFKFSSYAIGFNLHKWYKFLLRPDKIGRFNLDLQFKRRKFGSFFQNKDDDGATAFENQLSIGIAFLPTKKSPVKRTWKSVDSHVELEGDLVE